MIKLLRVVVRRSRWLRGGKDSKMRNKSRGMCCLGFAGRAAGTPASQLVWRGTPADVLQ